MKGNIGSMVPSVRICPHINHKLATQRNVNFIKMDDVAHARMYVIHLRSITCFLVYVFENNLPEEQESLPTRKGVPGRGVPRMTPHLRT